MYAVVYITCNTIVTAVQLAIVINLCSLYKYNIWGCSN